MSDTRKSRKIYIAGPYTAGSIEDLMKNVNAAIDAGLVLYAKGHFPFIPHLTHWVDERARELGTPMRWEDYIRWDMVWLRECEALLYLAPSTGADLELAAAQKMGLEVFRSIEEVPAVEPER